MTSFLPKSQTLWVILKLYGLLFFVSHIPFAVMAFNNIGNQNITISEPSNFLLFEKCSNEMFNRKDNLNQKLTADDHERMEICLKRENM